MSASLRDLEHAAQLQFIRAQKAEQKAENAIRCEDSNHISLLQAARCEEVNSDSRFASTRNRATR